jgi:hypothetical protein
LKQGNSVQREEAHRHPVRPARSGTDEEAFVGPREGLGCRLEARLAAEVDLRRIDGLAARDLLFCTNTRSPPSASIT